MGRSLETQRLETEIDTVVQAIRALRPPREIARTSGLPLERVLDIWDALALATDRKRAAAPLSASPRRRVPASATQQDLVTQHLRIATHVACKLYRTHPAVHMIGTLDDVIQVARLGLIDAARLFDPAAGVKFTSYAPRRVRGEILTAARDGGLVRVPRTRQGAGRSGEVNRTCYLDDLVHENGRKKYDPFEASRVGAPLEASETVELALQKLPQQTATILVEYFGLRGCRPRTLGQIAEELGVCESRVSQLLGPAWRRFVDLVGGDSVGDDAATVRHAHRAVVPVSRHPIQPQVGEYHTCNTCGTEHEPDEWRRRGKLLACRRCGTTHQGGPSRVFGPRGEKGQRPGGDPGSPSPEQIARAAAAIRLEHEATGHVESGRT